MAGDGVTTETDDREASEEAVEETDESQDEPDRDEEGDAHTCDECGAPMKSEVVDFNISENSKWADMGGSGEVEYAEVCSNEDCPTHRRDGEPERESESEQESTGS